MGYGILWQTWNDSALICAVERNYYITREEQMAVVAAQPEHANKLTRPAAALGLLVWSIFDYPALAEQN